VVRKERLERRYLTVETAAFAGCRGEAAESAEEEARESASSSSS